MTYDPMDLARRLVACRGFRWLDGMRAFDGDGRCAYRLTEHSGLPGHPAPVVDDSWRPDLHDAATLGALLGLLREAADCCWLSVVGSGNGWRIDAEDGPPWVEDLHSLDTEQEAIVLAFEAAGRLA